MGKLILLEKIEACRQELIALTTHQELTSPAVIASSMELDVLINEYLAIDQNLELTAQ